VRHRTRNPREARTYGLRLQPCRMLVDRDTHCRHYETSLGSPLRPFSAHSYAVDVNGHCGLESRRASEGIMSRAAVGEWTTLAASESPSSRTHLSASRKTCFFHDLTTSTHSVNAHLHREDFARSNVSRPLTCTSVLQDQPGGRYWAQIVVFRGREFMCGSSRPDPEPPSGMSMLGVFGTHGAFDSVRRTWRRESASGVRGCASSLETTHSPLVDNACIYGEEIQRRCRFGM
jgi:hypothetical protein